MSSRTGSQRAAVLWTGTALCVALAWGCNADDAKRRYLQNGDRLSAEKRYAEAIVEYRNALQQDEKFGEARAHLADALSASNEVEEAYREYLRAADSLPDNLDVQRKAITYLFLSGQFEDVRARGAAFLLKHPMDLDVQLLYANALAGLRDVEGGVREIEEAVQLDPTHAATYTNLAMLKMAQGQRQAAEAAYQKAIALEPRSIRAHLALVHFDLSTGNVGRAEQSLEVALKLDPRHPQTNRVLAALYLATGRDALAEAPLKVAAETEHSPRARFALADYYARVNRVAEAEAIVKPMAQDPATFADAQTRLALLARGRGDAARATAMLAEVLKQYPNHTAALQAKARWLMQDGQPRQALERLASVLAVTPRDVNALFLQGTVQAAIGQRDAAMHSFGEVLRFNPRAAAAQVQLAQLTMMTGATGTAVGLAFEAVKNAPGVPEARLVLARTLVAQREYTRADTEIAALLSAYPRASGVHALKGTLQMLRNDPPGARAAYQTALTLEPGSIAALMGLTILDAQQNQLPVALARVEGRLKLEPRRPGLLVMAARIHLGLKDLPSAERVLRQAMQVAPTMSEPYAMLGEIYRAQNRMDAARVEFDAQARKDARNVSARTMAALIVHAQQNQPEAKRRYEEVLALEPKAAVAANNLAWIYADEQQNLDRAVQLALRAAEETADLPDAWDTLGWVYYRKRLPNLAIQPFERAVANAPDNATFHYHLGLALTGAGDRARGRASFETALKLQPDFPDARRELTALAQ